MKVRPFSFAYKLALSALVVAVEVPAGAGAATAARSMPVAGPQPGLYGYVANTNSNDVSVFNTSTRKVIRTIANITAPTAVVANAGTPSIFVASQRHLFAIDVNTNVVTPIAGACPSGGPNSMAFSNDARRLYFVDACRGRLGEVGTTTNRLVKEVVLMYQGFQITPAQLIGNPSDPYLYVLDAGETLYRYGIGEEALLDSFQGSQPVGPEGGFAIDPSGTILFVASSPAGNNTLIDQFSLRDDAHVGSADFQHPYQARGLALVPPVTALLVTDSSSGNTLDLDPITLHSLGALTFSSAPSSIIVDRAGTTAYATLASQNSVSVADVAGRKVVGTIPVGQAPAGVAIWDVPPGGVATPSPPNCGGKIARVTLVPDASDSFVLPTLAGYRMVGPLAQQFDALPVDCVDRPVTAKVTVAVQDKRITIRPVPTNPLAFTIRTSGPLAPQTITTTAVDSHGRKSTSSFALDAAPAVYEAQPYINFSQASVIQVYDDKGNLLPIAASNFSGVGGPSGIAYEPIDGTLRIVDRKAKTIVVTDLLGHVAKRFSNPHLTDPVGIVVDPATGNMYVHNFVQGSGKQPIVVLSIAGKEITPKGFAQVASPYGLALNGKAHLLYVIDSSKYVDAFDLQGNLQIQRPATLTFQQSVGYDAAADRVFVADGGHTILTYSGSLVEGPAYSELGSIADATAMAFDSFRGYMLLANGNFQQIGYNIPAAAAIDSNGHAVSLTPNGAFFSHLTQSDSGICVVL